MFEFWRSEEHDNIQPCPNENSSQSWYSSSVLSSPSSSRPSTPSDTYSSSYGLLSPTASFHSPSHVLPAEAAGVIAVLKYKSAGELLQLLSDKEAYQQFLLSLDQVKIQNNLKYELCKENSQLAEKNLQKEPRVIELRNQCKIIRTAELAAAQERLNELEKRKEETLKTNSPASLLQRIQESMNKLEEDCENLHRQLLDGDIDIGAFVKKYKQLRATYHRRALTHLTATSSTRPIPT